MRVLVAVSDGWQRLAYGSVTNLGDKPRLFDEEAVERLFLTVMENRYGIRSETCVPWAGWCRQPCEEQRLPPV